MIDLEVFGMKNDIQMFIGDIERTKNGAGGMLVDIHWAAAHELISRMHQLEREVARYQWLRDEAQDQDLHVITSLESLEWDSFIDTVMSERGGGNL